MAEKLKIERSILILLLLTSLTFHIVFAMEGQAQVAILEKKLELRTKQTQYMQNQIDILEIMLQNREQDYSKPVMDEPEKQYIGEFEITYYTAGPESTGKNPGHPAYGITRSGTKVEEGRTIAADWSLLKPGTKVYIDDIGERIVEDTGGLIVDKCIDVYVEDEDVARQLGRHKANVWIVKEEEI